MQGGLKVKQDHTILYTHLFNSHVMEVAIQTKPDNDCRTLDLGSASNLKPGQRSEENLLFSWELGAPLHIGPTVNLERGGGVRVQDTHAYTVAVAGASV